MKALTFLEFYTQLCEKYGEDALYDVRKLNALAKYNKLVSQPFEFEKITNIFKGFVYNGLSFQNETSGGFELIRSKNKFQNKICFFKDNDANTYEFYYPTSMNDFITYINISGIELEFTPETIKKFNLDKK